MFKFLFYVQSREIPKKKKKKKKKNVAGVARKRSRCLDGTIRSSLIPALRAISVQTFL